MEDYKKLARQNALLLSMVCLGVIPMTILAMTIILQLTGNNEATHTQDDMVEKRGHKRSGSVQVRTSSVV